VGYHVYLPHGTSVFWQFKTQLESGPVTADLTTAIIHSYKLLINNVKPIHKLTHSIFLFKAIRDVKNKKFRRFRKQFINNGESSEDDDGKGEQDAVKKATQPVDKMSPAEYRRLRP